MKSDRAFRSRHRQSQRGLSIIELMVGVAVGLFVAGGAAKLFVDNLSNNRRMLVETRINQDLRAVMDIMVGDIRRAGYWTTVTEGVNPFTITTAPSTNPQIRMRARRTITA